MTSDSKTHGVFALLGNGLALGRFRQKSSKTQGNLSKIGIRLFFRSFCGSSELLCSLPPLFRNGQNARDIRKFRAALPRQAPVSLASQKSYLKSAAPPAYKNCQIAQISCGLPTAGPHEACLTKTLCFYSKSWPLTQKHMVFLQFLGPHEAGLTKTLSFYSTSWPLT